MHYANSLLDRRAVSSGRGYHTMSFEVVWHQKCTHFPVFQLAVNGAIRTTQWEALLSQVHVLCPL